MRQYTPVWQALKKHKTAKLVAHASRHRTIIQAVRKEKWRDLGFKLLASEQGKIYKLYEEVDTEHHTITFYLQDVSGITIKDL